MDHTIASENDATRQALAQLVSRLDKNSYSYFVSPTWTIATTLCHLAFWDQRALFLLKQWRADGRIETPRLDPPSVDSINQAVNLIALQVSGPTAGRLALECAAAVDALVAEMDDGLANRIDVAGFGRYLRRSLHRNEHIQRVHEVLNAKTSTTA
jgi:DinB family protein